MVRRRFNGELWEQRLLVYLAHDVQAGQCDALWHTSLVHAEMIIEVYFE
jgi:hypothetical protein